MLLHVAPNMANILELTIIVLKSHLEMQTRKLSCHFKGAETIINDLVLIKISRLY